MSESIFETFTDERGNISVRISQEVQVLTREEANRIEAEYRRMQAENAKLREQSERLFDKTLELATENSKLRELCKLCEREAENAKLRELVGDMYGFIERTDEECGDVTFSDCFDYCKHDATDDGCCKTGECWYEQRMRELGVVE